MAKAQYCLMCADELYQMSNYGEPADGNWPPMIEDEKYGTLDYLSRLRGRAPHLY